MTDEDYMKYAEEIALQSRDSVKVGAIVVDSRGIVIAEGSNDFPVSMAVEKWANYRDDKKLKNKLIRHAETDCLADLMEYVRDRHANEVYSGLPHSMYISRYPCLPCCKAIEAFGISRIVVPEVFPADSSWCESMKAGIEFLEACGREVVRIGIEAGVEVSMEK